MLCGVRWNDQMRWTVVIGYDVRRASAHTKFDLQVHERLCLPILISTLQRLTEWELKRSCLAQKLRYFFFFFVFLKKFRFTYQIVGVFVQSWSSRPNDRSCWILRIGVIYFQLPLSGNYSNPRKICSFYLLIWFVIWVSLYFFYKVIYQFVPRICVNCCHCVVGEQISTEMGFQMQRARCVCVL